MRIVFGLVAVTTAACSGDDGGLPIGGGGNDGGFQLPDSTVVVHDAAVDGAPDAFAAPIDGNIFTGRVCLAADPTALNTCAATGAGGLTVRLGTASTTTNADGTFMIVGSSADKLWRVTGPNIVSSYMAIGDYEIPALSRTSYTAMITNNLGGQQLNPGEGSAMVQVIQNGAGVAAATAVATPTPVWATFYDHPATPTTWEQDATEANGAIWVTGLDVGMATVDVSAAGGDLSTGALPIFDGGITFATVIYP
jgi:hypothetical protein